MASEPLIVLNALTLRADSSPPAGTRRARPRFNVNRAGAGIEDPDTTDRSLSLSAQPQLEWEAYDEYWRKTHGPKILHQDGPDDTATALLQYYVQQHRLPAGPCRELPPPYSAGADSGGLLVRDPAARCAPHARPAWDGLAQLGYRNRTELETFFGSRKYLEKIVPDEAVFLRGFGFHLAEEHLVVQRGERRRDPIILLKLHARNAELSREEFRGRWMAQHAGLMRELPEARALVRRYAQLVNVSMAGDRLYDPVGDLIDGVGVYSFANVNDCEDFVAGDAHAALAADEQAFAAATTYFTALNYVIRDVTA
jgi:hypothetical protein